MSKLPVKSARLNEKIIATWPANEAKIITFNFWDPEAEERQEQAVHGKFISNRKIADYRDSDFNALEVELIALQRFLGIKNLIGDIEMGMLLEFLGDYASDFSSREIIFAVKQAIAGNIHVAKEDMEHYGEFTAKYLQPILATYRIARGRLISKYTDQCLAMEIQNAKSQPLSEDEQAQIIEQLLTGAFENFKSGLNFLGSDRIFDILWAAGAIPFDRTRMQEFEAATIAEFKRLEHRDKSAGLVIEGMRLKIDVTKIPDPDKPTFYEKMAIYSHNEITKTTKTKALTTFFSSMVKEEKNILSHYQEHKEKIKKKHAENQQIT